MNSWSSATTSRNNGHQRSVSIGGYNGMINSDYGQREPIVLGNYDRPVNQCHASYMDLNRSGANYYDSRRLFSWRSPSNHSEYDPNVDRNTYSNDQRPFETAFKAAISKMKESSISRLGVVDRNSRNSLFGQNNIQASDEDAYRRNCMTLQPRKIAPESRVPGPSNKIFKCNSTADRCWGGDSSVKTHPVDCPSEREYDKNYKENQYRSVSNLYSDPVQNQENGINRGSSTLRKDFTRNEMKTSSATKIVIPIKKKPCSAVASENMSVAPEAYISPKVAPKAHSAFPKMDYSSMDIKEDSELESLSSLGDNVAKWNNLDNKINVMSKSLTLTSDKPPMKTPQRTGSQKALESSQNSYQNEQIIPGKRMSGLYKKSLPTPVKGKAVSNMPIDFQKLHSAFLEQNQEIKNLKQELAEKVAYISQLESEIRGYEPWR